MILHHTASKDTYITNKVIGGASRATTANVGYASTIDIFKLHNESTLIGDTGNIQEVSRGLIYFNESHLSSLMSGKVGVSDSSLQIKLILKDVQGSQVAPANFTLELYPLDATWVEGIGDDIITFSNVHATNWLSSSLATLWSTAGGTFTSNSAYKKTQIFTTGTEDISFDVKAFMLAAIAESVNNYGFIIKLTSALEANSSSYFVKRFASRHTRNPFLRPRLEVSWHNYHEDHRLLFEDNIASQKLSIRNYSHGAPAIPKDYQGNAVSASNLKVRLHSGSWYQEQTSTPAVVSLGTVTQTGMYEATFAKIDIYDTDDASGSSSSTSGASLLATKLKATGSIDLQEKWYTGTFDAADMTIHYSGSVKLKYSQAQGNNIPRDLQFSLLDLKKTYPNNSLPTVRLFLRDRTLADEPVRIPIQLPSIGLAEAYYKIKDSNNETVLIPFSYDASSTNYSTRLSRDGGGMYFTFPTSVLPRGRTYSIDIKYKDRGQWRVWESNQAFRVI